MEFLDGLGRYLVFSSIAFLMSSLVLITLGHRIKVSKVKSNQWLSAAGLYLLYALASLVVANELGYAVSWAFLLVSTMLGLPVIYLAQGWNLTGSTSFAILLQLSMGFILYIILSSLSAAEEFHEYLLAAVSILLVASAMILALLQAYELIDVLCRRQWKRLAVTVSEPGYYPKVSLHVPAYNEPPEMVMATLDSLSLLDYPNYEIIMIDDNTEDQSLWGPVEAHCKKIGCKFFHLENWPGYKSGALNFALTKTASDVEIVGIVDADYIVDKNYLKDLVSHFKTPEMAFVQTPQDYRDFDTGNRYLMAMYHAYQYFFKLSMASRNERNGIIFTGTMGLIRKQVLQDVGGWDEWCITEDAEISIKILDRGYQSIFVDKTYGRGLMPLDFDGLKRQRFRWAFGGMQVLRLHWKKLLPWKRYDNKKNAVSESGARLNLGQKIDFWSGGIQWLNDPVTFLFTLFLLTNAVVYLLTGQNAFKNIAGAIIYVPFVFIFTSMARTLWGMKIRLGCSFVQAFYALIILLSLTWVVTKACVLGLTQANGVFLRTPKQKSNYGLLKVVRIVDRELMIVVACLISIIALLTYAQLIPLTLVMVCLLSWQVFIYATALIASYWSYRTDLLVSSETSEDLDSAGSTEIQTAVTADSR